MKIDIAYNDSLRTIDPPIGVYFVGITAIYKGDRYGAFNAFTDSPYKQDEEIVFDENFRIILHYYSNAILEEILDGFSGYESIRFMEIENEKFHISVCV